MSLPSSSPLASLQIDWSGSDAGIVKTARHHPEQLQEQTERALNMAMSSIQIMASRLSKTIRAIEREAMPQAAEIEFGIRFDLESGALIAPVAKLGSGAQLLITFKWAIETPMQATVLVSSE